jgi:hypothetical protein
MADDPYNYSKPNAVTALKDIRKTTGSKRIAFAVGRFGPAVPVVMILRGGPSKARLKLEAAHYAENSKPSGVNLRSLPKKPIHVNHGELVWDPDTGVLTLECAKEANPVLGDMFWNFYQKQWGLTPFWKKELNFGNLSADAESRSEAEDGGGAAVAEPIDTAFETLADVPIIDESGNATTGANAPAGSHDVSDAEGDLTPGAAKVGANGRTKVTDPAIQANAKKLAQSLLEIQNNLGMAAAADRAELEALFESALENTAQQHLPDNGTEPKPDQPGVQDGIDVVADVLVAMGTKLARQRGLLGSGELPDGSRIRAMVGKDWNLRQKQDPAVLVERLIKIVGLSFAKDGDTLRGFLGLRPADALIPFLVSRWQDAHASVVARIAELQTAVDETLKREDPTDSVEKRGGSWEKVDQVSKDLDPARLAESLRALKGAKGDERLQRTAGLKAAIDDHRKYIEDSVVITELDRNPFDIDSRVRDTFSTVLTEILERVPPGS